MTTETTPRTDAEQRVIDVARKVRDTRQQFANARVNKWASGPEVAAARTRRDRAINELIDAVEELETIGAHD